MHISGTRRLFSVKYLFGEAKLLEQDYKFIRSLFHACTSFEANPINSLRFSEV